MKRASKGDPLEQTEKKGRKWHAKRGVNKETHQRDAQRRAGTQTSQKAASSQGRLCLSQTLDDRDRSGWGSPRSTDGPWGVSESPHRWKTERGRVTRRFPLSISNLPIPNPDLILRILNSEFRVMNHRCYHAWVYATGVDQLDDCLKSWIPQFILYDIFRHQIDFREMRLWLTISPKPLFRVSGQKTVFREQWPVFLESRRLESRSLHQLRNGTKMLPQLDNFILLSS